MSSKTSRVESNNLMTLDIEEETLIVLAEEVILEHVSTN